MEIDISSFFKVLDAQLAVDATVQASMEVILENCASFKPEEWIPYRNIDYNRDMSALMEALNKIAETKDVAGVYIGIFNPVVGGKTTSDMYAVGCSEYDSDDEGCEWAFSHKEPEKHAVYFGSEVHGDIYGLAYQDKGLGNNAEYPLCLAYTALAANRAAREMNYLKPISAGFDSGDIILVYTP
ncbi:MAG TPA: hypothetical protein ACFCUC_17775 [Desulfobacterales bacterium]